MVRVPKGRSSCRDYASEPAPGRKTQRIPQLDQIVLTRCANTLRPDNTHQGCGKRRSGNVDNVEGGLRIDVDHRSQEVVVALRGELDVRNVELLRRAFSNLDPAYGACVAVDCGQLGFLGAAGIGAIAAAADAFRREGHRLYLVRPSDFVRQLFLLTGLGFLLPEPESPGHPYGMSPATETSGAKLHRSDRISTGGGQRWSVGGKPRVASSALARISTVEMSSRSKGSHDAVRSFHHARACALGELDALLRPRHRSHRQGRGAWFR